MFYYIVSDKNGEMYQRSYSVINRKRSLVDDQQLVKFINIFQPGSRLVRQFIFNLQVCRGDAKTISLGNIVLMWLLLEATTCCSIDSKNRFWAENVKNGK
jgi:hypothetical protein